MGRKAVYKYIALMFLVIQVVLSFFTIAGLYGGDVTPIGNSARAMLVYVLPVLILADIVMLGYWLVRRKWLVAALDFLTIACCIPYIGTVFQPRTLDKSAEAQRGVKIATYNVAMFNRETSGFVAQDILAQMRHKKVDICCLQEYNDVSGDKKNSESYSVYFPYHAVGRDDMIIYSRYPIKQSKAIPFEYTNNSAMWADIDVDGETVRVFNVHLQTTGISRTLHQAAKMSAMNAAPTSGRLTEAIFGNYLLGLYIRAGQAQMVANEIRRSPNPCIVCGDFNDVPYSYVYNVMLGDLTDGFKECGAGPMYTFRGMKPVRIDYIFHDAKLKGLTYEHSKDITYSDHYPVFMKLSL